MTTGGWDDSCRASEGDFCDNGLETTSPAYDITPGHQYNWWVHALDDQGHWSKAADGPNFTCNLPSPTSIITPSVTPILTPTPTPTSLPGEATLNFRIKFQGIGEARANRTVSLVLKQGEETKYTFTAVDVSADQQKNDGTYQGSVAGITPGTYEVYIKGWAHLTRKFADVVVNEGVNTLDGTGKELLAGDFVPVPDGNNILNIDDIADILSLYTQLSIPVDQSNQRYDLNADGVFDISDISFVLTNYTELEVHGE